MTERVIIILLGLLVFQPLYAGKLHFKLAAEGGTHRFENRNSEPLLRFSATFKFKQFFEQQYLNMGARLVPEIMGLGGNTSSFKFSGNLQSGRTFSQGGWEAGLRAKNYFYLLNSGNAVYFAVADFGLSGFYRKQGSGFYIGRINYIYRDLDTRPANRLDALRAAAGLMWKRRTNTHIQILCVLERFRISTRQQNRINSGWRAGPEINFQYQAKLFFRSTLRLLYHDSALNPKAGNEFQTQIVLGKFLSPRLSLFAYINYRLLRRPKGDIPTELLYSAVENENWYYVKLEFEPLKRFAAYLRAGYFYDRLPEQGGTFSGMQAVFGLSWKTP